MKKRWMVAVALLACATNADAQTRQRRSWTVFASTGWMAVDGHGSETLMKERVAGLMGLRFRLEDSDWWLGVELDSWNAEATQAGRDTIIARSFRSGTKPTGRASFYSSTLSFVLRRDFWESGPFDAYVVGTIGSTMSGGKIVGKCYTNTQGFPICTEPPLDSRGPGLSFAPGIGAGVTARYSQFFDRIPKWASWVLGDRLILEGKLNSQTATEGRYTSAVGYIGIGW